MADEDRSFDPSQTEIEPWPGAGLERERPRGSAGSATPIRFLRLLELDADDDLKSEPGDEGAILHANHATRGRKPDRSAGRKTRAATKDQISRR